MTTATVNPTAERRAFLARGAELVALLDKDRPKANAERERAVAAAQAESRDLAAVAAEAYAAAMRDEGLDVPRGPAGSVAFSPVADHDAERLPLRLRLPWPVELTPYLEHERDVAGPAELAAAEAMLASGGSVEDVEALLGVAGVHIDASRTWGLWHDPKGGGEVVHRAMRTRAQAWIAARSRVDAAALRIAEADKNLRHAEDQRTRGRLAASPSHAGPAFVPGVSAAKQPAPAPA